MSDKLFIFDTTLRDGEQVPGCQLNTVEKIQVAKALELLGGGGTELSLDNQGFGASADWGTNFQKIATMHWALTARDNTYWLVGYNWESARSRNEFSAWTGAGTSTWPSYRCVRSVVD